MTGRKTGGRQKGTSNKVTASIKEALRQAFDERGGVAALLKWAESNETAFYQLVARLIPTEVTGPNGGPVVERPRQVWVMGDQRIEF